MHPHYGFEENIVLMLLAAVFLFLCIRYFLCRFSEADVSRLSHRVEGSAYQIHMGSFAVNMQS